RPPRTPAITTAPPAARCSRHRARCSISPRGPRTVPEKTDTWRKISRGIWRSATTGRWRVFSYKVHPQASEKLPAKMDLKQVKLWRQGWEADLLRELEPPQPEDAVPLGFTDEARTKYLPAVRSMPTFATRERHIEEWCEVFGDRPRRSIRAYEIRA